MEIINDIKDEKIKRFRDIDIASAGVPCQSASVAGKKRGTTDERWLWPETLATIRAVRPQWALLENVPGLFWLENGIAFNGILSGLAEIGYDCWWETIPACAVGAPHRRDRIWIVAYNAYKRQCNTVRAIRQRKTESERGNQNVINPISIGCKLPQGWDLDGQILHKKQREKITDPACRPDRNVTNTTGKRLQRVCQSKFPRHLLYAQRRSWQENWIEAATRLCRMDDGISDWLDGNKRIKNNRANRLKSLGNAIVPSVVAVIMEAIKEIDNANKGMRKLR